MNGEGVQNEKNLVFRIYLWMDHPMDDHGVALSCPEIAQNLNPPLQ
jgi:hypothetical protein